MIPAAYSLKKTMARHAGKFWRAERIEGLITAPVYVFPDQERFDADDIEIVSRWLLPGELQLPHEAVFFEVVDQKDSIGSQVVYVCRTAAGIEGFFWHHPRDLNKWTDVLAHGMFLPDGWADIELNPKITGSDRNTYAQCLSAIVWRALAVLSLRPELVEAQVPRTRRPKFARAGVTGWTWHIAHINLQAAARAAKAPAGGAHASPRWHIRRGHWRTLSNGRRVFVRECAVGDSTVGGVLKDYEVAA